MGYFIVVTENNISINSEIQKDRRQKFGKGNLEKADDRLVNGGDWQRTNFFILHSEESRKTIYSR